MNQAEGYLKKWSYSKNSWIDVYCKVLPSGWFQWFASPPSTGPKRSIQIQSVWNFLAFDQVLAAVPNKPPGLDPHLYPLCFAIPQDRDKVAFFQCASPEELTRWRDAICSAAYPTNQPSMPTSSQPPPYPADIGFGMPGPQPPPPYAPPPTYPTQPAYNPNPMTSAYPQQPPAQPVYGVASSSYPRQPPPPGGYPAYGQTSGPAPPGGYAGYGPPQYVDAHGRPYEIVYVDGQRKKKRLGGLKNAAVGLASGLAGGYLASKLFGGMGMGWGRGPFGGFGGGFGRWGSWSSLSSLSWSD